jgi:hypothetical protein
MPDDAKEEVETKRTREFVVNDVKRGQDPGGDQRTLAVPGERETR